MNELSELSEVVPAPCACDAGDGDCAGDGNCDCAAVLAEDTAAVSVADETPAPSVPARPRRRHRRLACGSCR